MSHKRTTELCTAVDIHKPPFDLRLCRDRDLPTQLLPAGHMCLPISPHNCFVLQRLKLSLNAVLRRACVHVGRLVSPGMCQAPGLAQA